LNKADRITGGATLVLLVSLFIPWFGVSYFEEDGLSSHGYLYIVLLVSIALLVYLISRAGWDKLPINRSLAHAPTMFVATVINFVLVLFAFIFKPAGVGWEFGAYLALIVAAVGAAPLALPAIRARTAAR
jgi:hypothetical protein